MPSNPAELRRGSVPGALKIVVDQADDEDDDDEDLTAAEAREFAQASLGAFGEDNVPLDPFDGVTDLINDGRRGTGEQSRSSSTINVVVTGASSAERKSFVQKALNLPTPSTATVSQRRFPLDGRLYTVRLHELSIEDVSVDEEEQVEWPDTISERISGALTLVDVTDLLSFKMVPGVLNAIGKAGLPSVLVSTNCHVSASEREMDIEAIEKRAKKVVGNLGAVQVLDESGDDHRRAVAMVLRAIVSSSASPMIDKHPLSSAYWVAGMLSADSARSRPHHRQRAQSSATRPLSPRQHIGHSRASSEFTRGNPKEYNHVRHESSFDSRSSNESALHLSDAGLVDVSNLQLNRDSVLDTFGELDLAAGPPPGSPNLNGEAGTTFPDLVDRLLAQPTTKADNKLAPIFLALYRKFASPGRLLSALIARFNALDRNDGRNMIKTVEQLRHLQILEQWISSYPGDFAYPRTKQQMRNFISRLSQIRIFAIAAKEMGTHLDMVREDDDTIWACTDRADDLERGAGLAYSAAVSHTAHDPNKDDEVALHRTERVHPDDLTEYDVAQASRLIPLGMSSSLMGIETAQKQARLFQPTSRQVLSKIHWHALMELSDDVVARELTQLDWTLFAATRPRDMVRQVSVKQDESEKYRNGIFVSMISSHFNHIASWVANFILLRDKAKHRALIMEKFMRVARRLRELNNYNALGAIIAGIKSTSIYRLTATRDLIQPGVWKDWMKLEILMAPSRSHAAYRLAWENTSDERIPYLPLHRRDLVSAEEGNKTFISVDGDERINWKKFEIMGEVIVSLQRAQGMPYRGIAMARPDPLVRELLLDVRLEHDEDVLYERSLHCEPIGSAVGPTQKFREFFKR